MKKRIAYTLSFKDRGYMNFLEALFSECDCLLFYMKETKNPLNKKDEQFLEYMLQNIYTVTSEEVEEDFYGRAQRNCYQILITPEFEKVFKEHYPTMQALFASQICEEWMFQRENHIVFWAVSDDLDEGLFTLYLDKEIAYFRSIDGVIYHEMGILS